MYVNGVEEEVVTVCLLHLLKETKELSGFNFLNNFNRGEFSFILLQSHVSRHVNVRSDCFVLHLYRAPFGFQARKKTLQLK